MPIDHCRGRAHISGMFVRKTQTRSKSTAETYFTYRLVTSLRSGSKVSQITLLNLGRHFNLPEADWPRLCSRIEALLKGEDLTLFPESEVIEAMAQRYTARLIVDWPSLAKRPTDVRNAPEATAPLFAEVDTASLQLIRPRSIGVEAVGLAAKEWLGFDEILRDLGFNGVQRAAVSASLIGRMAAPGSELSTWHWLRQRSGLGELLDVDFEAMPLIRLYRASDLLVKHRDKIEDAVFGRLQDLFGFETTVTLYDLTNTYFEGTAVENPKAARARSKEKRSDCPLVTLGLVLDGSGFVRRSRMFEGNVAEARTLAGMLEGLRAPQGALVIMDAGIATAANIAWLREHKYRYLVVSRERKRQFDPEQAGEILTATKQTVRLQRVEDKDNGEVRLYCHSTGRQAKEGAIDARFALRFETGLAAIAAGLDTARGRKSLAAVQQRIGRLKQKCHGVGQHYQITVTAGGSRGRVTAITWKKVPVKGSRLTHPGVYCLRSSETGWNAATLWRTYIMLTDLEAVFRGLKSELGLRPVFHRIEPRVEGHLFITVLAYQLVQTIRRKLKADDQNLSWTALRQILSVQQRVTATFVQRDGRTLHIRKPTVAEPALRRIYEALAIDPAPGGTRKHTA